MKPFSLFMTELRLKGKSKTRQKLQSQTRGKLVRQIMFRFFLLFWGGGAGGLLLDHSVELRLLLSFIFFCKSTGTSRLVVFDSLFEKAPNFAHHMFYTHSSHTRRLQETFTGGKKTHLCSTFVSYCLLSNVQRRFHVNVAAMQHL